MNTVSRRRIQWSGYLMVRQLRLFIEIARAEVDWDSPWVSMDQLYRIIQFIAQMDGSDYMDLDASPLAIRHLAHRFEHLSIV
ncbi:hypothetical protein FRC09_007140 [Ceratobasidium sp. 395]|nr:hypothetical protein FRC09_007140 [Ceratobasidium sp. 395]